MGFFPYEGIGKRPRKAKKETISYLTQIEAVLDEEEARQKNPESTEEAIEPVDVLANVLQGTKFELGSVSMDRNGSTTLERLVHLSTPYQLRMLLHWMRVGGGPSQDEEEETENDSKEMLGYSPALFTNRYSSHVLQTIFDYTGKVIQAELMGIVDEAEADEESSEEARIPAMTEIILDMCKELHSNWANIGQDISGSFACRALSSVLAGVGIVQEKRGKNAKHQSSGTQQNRLSEGGGMGEALDIESGLFLPFPHTYRVPSSFFEELSSVLLEFTSLPSHILQGLCCDTFAGPLLALLLRLDAHVESPKSSEGSQETVPLELSEGSAGFALIKHALDWEDNDRSQIIVYGMSGERVGSHFLESVIRVAAPSFLDALTRRCFSDGQLKDYAADDVANYVVQALLQRVQKPQAKFMIKELIDAESTTSEEGNLGVLLRTRKAGVVWRLIAACAKHKILQKSSFHALEKALLDQEGKVVFNLLQAKLPDSASGKLTVNVPGARIIQQLLRFETSLSEKVVKQITELPAELLVALSKDNLGSRCVIDPLLEGVEQGEISFKIFTQFFKKLKGHYGNLAAERVGHHCIIKLYNQGNLDVKREIVEDLVRTKSRLQATTFGRKVLSTCGVESYEHRPDEWEQRLTRGTKQTDFLTEVFSVENVTKDSTSYSNGINETKDVNKKRKRNRNRKRVKPEQASGEQTDIFEDFQNANSQISTGDDQGQGKNGQEVLNVPKKSYKMKKTNSKKDPEPSILGLVKSMGNDVNKLDIHKLVDALDAETKQQKKKKKRM